MTGPPEAGPERTPPRPGFEKPPLGGGGGHPIAPPAGPNDRDFTDYDVDSEGSPYVVVAFQDLPLAERDHDWDGDAAYKRVRKWAGAEDEPNEKFRTAFVWYDADDKGKFKSYKLLIADVVDGRLHAIPRGVMAAGNVIQGGRGGVDLPSKDIDRVKNHLTRYYKKAGDEAPWQRD